MLGNVRVSLPVLFHRPGLSEAGLEASALNLFEEEGVEALHLLAPVLRV